MKHALAEARAQQQAAAEVLRIIASSGGELGPVFEAILANTVRLCAAGFANLWLYDDKVFRIAALHGAPEKYRDYLRRNPVIEPLPDNNFGRALKTRRVSQIDDLRKHASDGLRRASIKLARTRTVLAVPMLKGRRVIGMIAIYRQEVQPFTKKQIELVQSFAAQAVIAIENTRLLNELRQRTDDLTEALEQQTATSEVLKVISSSPGDLQPVFQAMLANATRICEAQFAVLQRFEGDEFYAAATLNISPALEEFLRRRGRGRAIPGSDMDELCRTKQVVHTPDMLKAKTPAPPARLAGGRTQLAVPMLKDGDLIGAIVIYRQEVQPFTDKQVELLQNFAAQAVIAIENARLLNELRARTDDLSESLEHRTATSEVLNV
ncbi:MAG: GAF domain-containing protein, partial [Bradyrhizobium sp.]